MIPHLVNPDSEDPARPAPARASAPAVEAFALLEQLPGGVVWLDPSGRVVDLNGIAALRLDAVRGECIGRDLFRDLLPALEAQGFGERYRQGMRGGQVALGCEAEIRGETGSSMLGLAIRSFVHAGLTGALVLLEDRSPLLAAEAQRQRLEGLAMVGELASGVAHEVNNPLASIKGFAQLLARDLTDDGHQQALEIISRETSRVASIIDRLLDFARQQRSSGRERVDLNALAAQAVDLRRYPLQTVGVEVREELAPDLSPVLADRGALQRVILALLGRAERVLAAHTGERRVVIRTRESTDGVVLYVADSGEGIARDALPRLFAGADPEEEWGGVGLDAALEAVRAQGGHLWADSVVGEGTVFYLRLPRTEVQDAPGSGSPTPPLHGVADRPLRVLVADDEPTLRLAIALFLGRHGHEVVQAVDALEALRLAQEQRFDVVLADARMPGDGLALIEKLEHMPTLRGRTVLMSGDHSHPGGAGGSQADRPYLAKPFDMTEVLRLVEALGR